MIISIIGPYIFNDIRSLLILTGLYIFTISQWYLFNKCLFTDIENYLAGEKTSTYNDGSKKSFMIVFLQKNLHISENICFFGKLVNRSRRDRGRMRLCQHRGVFGISLPENPRPQGLVTISPPHGAHRRDETVPDPRMHRFSFLSCAVLEHTRTHEL